MRRGSSRVVTGVGVIVCGLTAGACGGGDENGTATQQEPGARRETITIDLRQANKSGQSGTATITDRGKSRSGVSFGTKVVVEVSPPKRFPGTAQAPRIHGAPCATIRKRRGFEELSKTEVQTLPAVRAGRAEGPVARSLADLTAGGFSISVHQPRPPFRAVVCGDIPRR